MTAKQFFKSNVFKCLITLLCVLLVSGIFLSIANGFLEVTDEEMFQRKLNKQISAVYDGKSLTVEEVDISGQSTAFSSSTVQKLWLIKEENDYLVQTEGKGGYNGSIIVWTIIKMDDALSEITGIRSVSIIDYPEGELVNNISSANLQLFVTDYKAGIEYNYGDKTDPSFVKTNASYAFTAICNAVNGSIEFINAYASGIVKVDPFEGFLYTEFVNTGKDTAYELDEDGNVKFTVRTMPHSPVGYYIAEITVNAEGKIVKYTVTKAGATGSQYAESDVTAYVGKDLSYFTAILGEGMAYPGDNSGVFVPTGASHSNYLCMYAGAFATANYQKAFDLLNGEDGGAETAPEGGETDE